MSLSPHESEECVVQRSDIQPLSPKDARSHWEKFLDALRRTVGLKPIYLAERWALAKVRQEEVGADEKLMKARATYEKTMAEARRLELMAQSEYEKGMAEAEYQRLRNELIRKAIDPMVAQLLEARSQDSNTILEQLDDIIRRIVLSGGSVEIDLPPPQALEPDDLK